MADAEDGEDCEEEEDEEDYYEDERIVIIDNGSGTCKVGLSTDERPSHVFAEAVGKPRKGKVPPGDENKLYFGDELMANRRLLNVSYPIENGIIEDFADMENIWEHVFCTQLNVNPSEHAVLLTEPPYNPKPNREKMVETMFETFGVPSLNISIQGVLALLGQGRTTGLVLDSGEGVTNTIPIFDGFGLPHCINRVDVAGRTLNTLLAKLLAQEGCCLTTTEEQHHVRLMKEQHCYVALDNSIETAEEQTYTLPDGRTISLNQERWMCPEALFTPSLVGEESQGIAGLVWESISKCEIDLRRTLMSNIVLSGGSTMFEGFRERLHKEIRTYVPSSMQANVRIVPSKDPKDQQVGVWIGGQVFASLRNMQEESWVTYEDYQEYGANFIHEKIAVKYN